MAYYSSHSYKDDIGEYHWTPYSSSYDVVPYQASITPSDFEFHQPKFIEYYPNTYGEAYDPSITRSEINYSSYSVSEPQVIEHEPTLYGTDCSYSSSYEVVPYQSSITKSGFEFPEPNLLEYYPTTYGEAYDPSRTRSEINYSVYSVSEPQVIKHAPTLYGTDCPYSSSYDVVPYQSSITKSGFELHEPNFLEYCPTTYSEAYDPSITSSDIKYSSHSVSEPQVIEHEPTLYRTDCPYRSSYGVVPYQSSITKSGFEFYEPNFLEYYPSTYGEAYDSSRTRSEINYSTYNFSKPKTPYGCGFSSHTQHIISYSTLEFNEPDFIEYDPTPYGGGYDLTLTYGKPLPPSDEICYPRSTLESNGPSLVGFSYGSIPSPYGKDDSDDYSKKPSDGSKPTEVIEGGKRSNGDSGDGVNLGNDSGHGGNLVEPLDLNQGEETEECTYDYGFQNGRTGGYDYEYDKQGTQTQYGYGSEGLDFCESIFGYWPCLSRKHQRCSGHQEVADGNNKPPWKGTADYLFGYGEGRDEGRCYGSYGHEYCYQQQPCYGQEEEEDGNSWKHKFNIF